MQRLENLDNCAAHDIRYDGLATAKREIDWGGIFATEIEMASLKNGRDGRQRGNRLHRHIITIRIFNDHIISAI